MNISTEERFWRKVNKPVMQSDNTCWEWTASTLPKPLLPYGVFYFNGKNGRAHRYSYMLRYGKIPEGLEIRHSCHNPKCVRPEHLSVGTRQDNMNDKVNANRQHRPIGMTNVRSVLSDSEVVEIRKKFKPHKYTMQRLADEYRVSNATIQRVIYRKNWKHI